MLSLQIKQRAEELGFDQVGIARADHADPEGRLRAWLDAGFAGGMDYMHTTAKERADPRALLEGAKSIIALSISYFDPDADDAIERAELKVSRYALSDDYHTVLRRKVRKLRRFILQLEPNARIYPTVDTSPIMEREWAERAGIAWIGKSTMAISEELGTYTFLATLITDLDLDYDLPHPNRCGTCTACIDACPTDAFVGPYQLDARRCITYWTVEHRGAFDETTPKLFDWVAGCDICQEVCPWNKFASPTEERRFEPRPELVALDAHTISKEDGEARAEELIRGTALQRTGGAAFRRNLLRVLRERS